MVAKNHHCVSKIYFTQKAKILNLINIENNFVQKSEKFHFILH